MHLVEDITLCKWLACPLRVQSTGRGLHEREARTCETVYLLLWRWPYERPMRVARPEGRRLNSLIMSIAPQVSPIQLFRRSFLQNGPGCALGSRRLSSQLSHSKRFHGPQQISVRILPHQLLLLKLALPCALPFACLVPSRGQVCSVK